MFCLVICLFQHFILGYSRCSRYCPTLFSLFSIFLWVWEELKINYYILTVCPQVQIQTLGWPGFFGCHIQTVEPTTLRLAPHHWSGPFYIWSQNLFILPGFIYLVVLWHFCTVLYFCTVKHFMHLFAPVKGACK